MPTTLKLAFATAAESPKGILVVFCEEGLKFSSLTRNRLEPVGDLLTRAAAAERFKGKSGTSLNILAPAGLDVARLLVIGAGKTRDLKAQDFVKLGGVTMGKIPGSATEATILLDLPGGAVKPERAADLA